MAYWLKRLGQRGAIQVLVVEQDHTVNHKGGAESGNSESRAGGRKLKSLKGQDFGPC